MSDALTPDELGEVGESLFRKLCAQAKLTCNKADRDRAGWDFRVEFPMEESPGRTLDQRSPRACQIQLKCTAGESGTRVSVRLSSIERLAKDSAPAAVVVFRMRPDGAELMGYVIHLLNDELARVLLRLRRAEKDGREDINHMTISFNYRKGRRFKPDADGLREALAEMCPEDVAAYAEEKRDQLANLGYAEGGGLEAEALIWIESPDHLTKILSGLAPLKPLQLQAYDRRFGIRVPYQGTLMDEIEEFPIELPPAGPCSIVIRSGQLRPAALFRCEAFVPLPVEGGPLFVVRHPTLNVVFKGAGLQMETVGNFNVDRHGLDEWVLLLRGLSYLAEGTATIELEFGGARMPALPAPDRGLDGPNVDQLPRLLEFVERWQHALQLAGIPAAEEFSIEDIWSADATQMALDMLLNPTPVVRFEFDAIDGVGEEPLLEALYFNGVEFAGAGIAFATKVILERDKQQPKAFVSTRFELLDVRPTVRDLDAYGAEVATNTGIAVVIDPSNVTVVSRPSEEG